jgi:hypothetical protein
MTKQILLVVTLVASIFLLIIAALTFVASQGVTQAGSSAGLKYRLTNGALNNTSFVPLPGGFRYTDSSWLNSRSIEVICDDGQLSINGRPVIDLESGDEVIVTEDQQVLLNGNQLDYSAGPHYDATPMKVRRSRTFRTVHRP